MTLPKTAAANWGAAFRVAASEKWRKQSAFMGRAVTEAIVEFAAAKPGMRVLDLASGTGEPAISLTCVVGLSGRVVGIDLNAELLKIACERGQHRSLQNVSFHCGDAHHLPFRDNSFDLVTSRLGVMFFEDIDLAMSEALRVLKPGGRVAFLVWGSFEQPYFQTTVGVIMRHVPGAVLSAGTANMFRFSEPRSLGSVLQRAGFREIHEETRVLPWTWPGTPEEVWEYFRSVTAPFRPLIDRIPPEKLPQVAAEIHHEIGKYYDGRQVNFGATMVLASAIKT